MEAFGGMGMLAAGESAADAAAAHQKTRYYLLEQYYLRNSTQLPRMHEFMSHGFLPALSKVHAGPKVFLEALVAPHMPQYSVVLGFDSLDSLSSLRERLREDQSFVRAFAEWENGAEPPYEQFSHTLLKAAPYSPEIETPGTRAERPRVFELRVYHSPTWKQLAALHQRFAGPEIRIFHRLGIRPLFYSETVLGQNMPNLTYLIPFENLAAREKAWDAFAADPEWVKVRKESIDAHGQISSVIQIALFRPTPYSPVA
jgi:hypothetical protein